MPPKRKRASGETKDDLYMDDQTCEAFLDSLSYSQYAAVYSLKMDTKPYKKYNTSP